jgi:hypothetical protein
MLIMQAANAHWWGMNVILLFSSQRFFPLQLRLARFAKALKTNREKVEHKVPALPPLPLLKGLLLQVHLQEDLSG